MRSVQGVTQVCPVDSFTFAWLGEDSITKFWFVPRGS
jgi:hypothetical protein